MKLSSKVLIGLSVMTRTGVVLGKVSGFDIESDTGRIESFHVKSGGLVAGLLADELLVSWSAVVELSAERLVVADTMIPAGASVLAKAG